MPLVLTCHSDFSLCSLSVSFGKRCHVHSLLHVGIQPCSTHIISSARAFIAHLSNECRAMGFMQTLGCTPAGTGREHLAWVKDMCQAREADVHVQTSRSSRTARQASAAGPPVLLPAFDFCEKARPSGKFMSRKLGGCPALV